MIATAVFFGTFGQWTPQSDPLRRLRGWEALAQDVTATAKAHNATIIIADRRAEAALLSWHLHDTALSQSLDEDGRPGSHFELKHALQNDDIGPFLILTGEDGLLPNRFADSAKRGWRDQRWQFHKANAINAFLSPNKSYKLGKFFKVSSDM